MKFLAPWLSPSILQVPPIGTAITYLYPLKLLSVLWFSIDSSLSVQLEASWISSYPLLASSLTSRLLRAFSSDQLLGEDSHQSSSNDWISNLRVISIELLSPFSFPSNSVHKFIRAKSINYSSQVNHSYPAVESSFQFPNWTWIPTPWNCPSP
jgi:hypothetical protein